MLAHIKEVLLSPPPAFAERQNHPAFQTTPSPVTSACWRRIKVFWERERQEQSRRQEDVLPAPQPCCIFYGFTTLGPDMLRYLEVLSCPKSLATPSFLLPTNSQYSNSCCMQTFLLAFLCPVYFLAAFVLLISPLTNFDLDAYLLNCNWVVLHEGFSFSWSPFPGTVQPTCLVEVLIHHVGMDAIISHSFWRISSLEQISYCLRLYHTVPNSSKACFSEI